MLSERNNATISSLIRLVTHLSFTNVSIFFFYRKQPMKILIYLASLLLILHFCQTAALLVLAFENNCPTVSCPAQPSKPAKQNDKPSCPATLRCDPSNCFYTPSQTSSIAGISLDRERPDDGLLFLLPPYDTRVWQPPDCV